MNSRFVGRRQLTSMTIARKSPSMNRRRLKIESKILLLSLKQRNLGPKNGERHQKHRRSSTRRQLRLNRFGLTRTVLHNLPQMVHQSTVFSFDMVLQTDSESSGRCTSSLSCCSATQVTDDSGKSSDALRARVCTSTPCTSTPRSSTGTLGARFQAREGSSALTRY